MVMIFLLNVPSVSLDYLEDVCRKYGPFDGVAAFSEGSTTATVMLHLQSMFNKDPNVGPILNSRK